ncbi:MAG: RHS repeat-associated core domain-containing protein, partial [Clostridia bacterium]|nr:RHS repeat-associated core domain-containing protein [Clostridia bacterium]
YEPFGLVVEESGPATSGAERYTGKPLDAALDLYYFGARHYDSGLGRFITADPARDGLNWYAYCRQNPLIYVDPDGECPLLVITGAIGAAVGAGYEAILSYNQEGKINWTRVAQGAVVGGAVGLGGGAVTSLAASAGLGGACATLTAGQTMAGFTALVQGGWAATAWGVSKDGVNQGITHFFEYWRDRPDRMTKIAERLGIGVQAMIPTKAGFANFTAAALNIVNNIRELGGLVRTWESGKTAYWFNDIIVIVFNGRLQSMMPGTMKSFLGLK